MLLDSGVAVSPVGQRNLGLEGWDVVLRRDNSDGPQQCLEQRSNGV